MADVKVSDLTALATVPVAADQFMVLDVSDTTDAATGTLKKIAASVVGLDRNVLTYRALVTQTTTDAPQVTEILNTLGATIAWAYSSTGFYAGTLSSSVLSGGTTIRHQGSAVTATGVNGFWSTVTQSTNQIRLYSFNLAGSLANDVLSLTLVEFEYKLA